MAVIHKRTVYYEKKPGGVFRFSDFASVVTNLGQMIELRQPFSRRAIGGDLGDFDPADEMSRIDEMQNIDMLKEKQILSGGEYPPLHGGYLMPRVGR